MKVAIIHDYFKEYGGAERVIEVFHEMFPEAPVFVSYYDKNGLNMPEYFKDWDIRTSFMQKIPFGEKLLSPLKFLAPLAFESFDLKEYDLVISSSSAYFAKAVITKPESLHLGYINTPPRYLYGLAVAHGYKKNFFTRIGGEILSHIMRIIDFEISQRPDILIANSGTIKARIQKYYRRDSVVIYPPVDTEIFKNAKKTQGKYFLTLSRLDPHKNNELIIKAFNELGLPLKVAGSGRQEGYLKEIAKENIEFLGSVSEDEKVKLMAEAKAFVLAAEDEDFGITPVESQAAGTPVIALRAGGYKETVIPGKTGEFFDRADKESLMKVVKSFDPAKYKESDCRKQSEKFSKEQFKKEILNIIQNSIKSGSKVKN